MHETTKNKALHIDGDMILYKAACAAEEEIRWDDDTWTLQTNMLIAKDKALTAIERICDSLSSSFVHLYFTPRVTFRHDLWPAYKANRKDKRKPLGISELREYLMGVYESSIFANIEADDAIGLAVTKDPNGSVAVSGDKDFGTLPITWYNHLKDELRVITEEEADHFHLVQSLMGDSTDGFAGLKGFGIKTAEKLLAKKGATWQTVVEAYESKGFSKDDALMTARLARILRHGDYDYKTNEVTLWEPPV